tara:strand:- start:144 stop:431 length:288 start_codon:yes stop_codon:yes gene_type:complete
MECGREFHFKGGSLSCSKECREFYDIRMRESYNIIRKLTRNLMKKVEREEITLADALEQVKEANLERARWLRDKHIDTNIDWKGRILYPTDTEEE